MATSFFALGCHFFLLGQNCTRVLDAVSHRDFHLHVLAGFQTLDGL